MPPPRTAAGHAAAKLKSTMLAKLGGGNDDELLRSIQLCDRYLNSCNNTDAGLAVLKDEVKKILAGKDSKTMRATKVNVAHSRSSAGSVTDPHNGTRQRDHARTPEKAAPSTPPWMLPAIRMQGRAHISDANPYHKIARNLSSAEMTDDEIRAHNKALRTQKTRDLLDGQMKEVEAQRAADARARQKAKEDSDRQIQRHYDLTMAERKADYERAMGVRKLNEAQLTDAKRRQAEERARMEREFALERARDEEEKRRAEAERVARKRQQEEDMRRAAEDNQARMQMKVEARQREQDENLRIAKEQIRMAEEKEAKRLADLEALREKTLAKYRAAGGESRELDLAAKAAADEAKAEREAQEYARKLDEDIRRRKLEAKERTSAQLRSIDEQRERQRLEKQAEREEARRLGNELQTESAARKQAEKEAKAALRAAQRREAERLKGEMEAEARRRYDEATEQMGCRELAIHGQVVTGTSRPFHYFKAQDPST